MRVERHPPRLLSSPRPTFVEFIIYFLGCRQDTLCCRTRGKWAVRIMGVHYRSDLPASAGRIMSPHYDL